MTQTLRKELADRQRQLLALAISGENFQLENPLRALGDIFLRSTNLVTDTRGMASLTGVLPPYVSFPQPFAAIMTAALTGSLYYMTASPKDLTYVVAPVLKSRSARENLKNSLLV
ncbi:hypothetical protein FXO37_31814 [Capsicum annuum]|nr:hypothetical protein FXO37_31814 [Capsicum annuum]